MYDYHTHTFFSDDCRTPMRDMLDAACEKGVVEYAVTDHFDPDYPDPAYPFTVDFASYHKALEEAQAEYDGKIVLRKGLEIGIQAGATLEKCRAAANSYPYDFILGSFHCALGEDFCTTYFDHQSAEQGVKSYYESMYHCLQQFTDYDVLGHFNVIDRYSPYVADYTPYMEQIEAILKLVVSHGKGLEINTSSFRYGLGDVTTPSAAILKLYRELGGEVVTIGSDAHKAKDIGYKYDWAAEFLLSNGFTHLTLFEHRKPSFVKL